MNLYYPTAAVLQIHVIGKDLVILVTPYPPPLLMELSHLLHIAATIAWTLIKLIDTYIFIILL